MTYKETLAFLYTQLPMFQRQGSVAFKKDLTNILALLKVLDNPHQKFSSIHVGGTNGKGSVSHFLSAALQAGGFKTGLYTSPHYKDFRERIKVNGQYISKKEVVRFTDIIKPHLEGIPASFFELTVALAFYHFAKQKVNIAVVEVGLGGRLDSTNVLTPELSLITNISFDHQQFLGNTLTSIATEKAGIIKRNIPVVIGQTDFETASVFREKASQEETRIYFADQYFRASVVEESLTHTTYEVYRRQQLYTPKLVVNWHGAFQKLNLQTALMALEVWQKTNDRFLGFDAIEKGCYDLKTLSQFQGRWQILSQNPLVLVDSAHNEDGLKAILPALLEKTKAVLHIVLGVVNDKDLDKILPMFPTTAHYYFAKANVPRGLAADLLQQQASRHGLKGKTFVSVKNAFNAAKRKADTNDTIFIGGSIFTVAEVL